MSELYPGEEGDLRILEFFKILESVIRGGQATVSSRGLLVSVGGSGFVVGKWGVLKVVSGDRVRVSLEGEVDWLDPGEVKGEAEVPVKPRRSGRIPIAVVAKGSNREDRRLIWIEVSEGRTPLEQGRPTIKSESESLDGTIVKEAKDEEKTGTEVREPTELEKGLAILNENIAKLEELYKKGEVDEETYKILKEEYESKKKELEEKTKK